MNGKMYLQNPYLKDLKGKILSKKKENDKYKLILDRTIFRPNGLNEFNSDRGTIDGIEVVDVFEENGEIIHLVKEYISNVNIYMQIDWATRFDYMQQNTGQYILSASIKNLLNIDILNIKIDKKYCYIYIDSKEINDLQISRIERLANQIIYSNFKIENNIVLIKNQAIRRISIGNVIDTDCNEVHCSRTGEVGIIKILDYNKNKRSNIEIKFISGFRALDYYNHILK